MSWTTEKAAIKSAITGISRTPAYRLIPEILDLEQAPESYRNGGFVIKPIGSNNPSNITSSKFITTDVAQVDVSYLCNNDTERDTAFDDFLTVESTIKAISGFSGYYTIRTFERVKDHQFYFKGTLRFYIGIRSC